MKRLKNQRGFTLIEMLIVMLIITVLIAIAIPNVSKQTANVDDKGCKAFVHIIRGEYNLFRNVYIARLSEVAINQLLISSYIIAYLAKKNKRKQSILIELPTLLESLNNRLDTTLNTFCNLLMYLILLQGIGLFKGEEEGFNRIQAVGILFFVCHEGKPINLTNLIVRLFRANAINSDISLNKPFPVLVSDEWREQP